MSYKVYKYLIKSIHTDGQNIYLYAFDPNHIDRLMWNTRVECGELYNKSTLKLIKKWFIDYHHKEIEVIEVSDGTIVDNHIFNGKKWITLNK